MVHMFRLPKRAYSKRPFLTTVFLATFIVFAISYASLFTYARTTYHNKAEIGFEGYNMLHMKLVGVYSLIDFAYNDKKDEFVLDYTHARNWAWKAWWCATCYANIKDTDSQMTKHRLYDRALWEAGSWNAQCNGYNEIEIKTTGTPNKLWFDYWAYSSCSDLYTGKLLESVPMLVELIFDLLG